ncbi:MAG: T9SS type A sorting domain-containing protein, partial [Saprospiraceae bacterium]
IPTNYVYNSYFKKAVVKVDEHDQNLPIVIYPNPVTNELIIENSSENGLHQNPHYQIVDINSKLINQGIVQEGKNKIDMSRNSNGIYFVKLFLNNKLSVYKILKL